MRVRWWSVPRHTPQRTVAIRRRAWSLTVALAGPLVVAACGQKKVAAPTIGTAPVERRTIVVDAQATGTVEPINVIEVKSKASGQIVKMTVETGTLVTAGDLLVQVDTRDVTNQYDQAAADLKTAQASLEVARAANTRADELFAQHVITTPEYESAQLQLTQAQGTIVRATASLDLAKQRLEDATVVAPVGGTIIDKPVSLGQVIASATGSVTGGTTLLRMADLTRVRVRALVNETDIGNVRAGQQARVTVDAYPERPFQGMVEKIEPQAVVQQSVTMFPVIIALDNREGFLKPGMNGEVSMIVDRRENVLAVSNDAVRTVREAAMAAGLLGLNPESVQVQVRAMQSARRAPSLGTPSASAPSVERAPSAGTPSAGTSTRTAARTAPTASRARTALVFVQEAGRYTPRLVRLGATNYDYAEVLEGLQDGDQVAVLNVAALQAKRDAQNSQMRGMGGGLTGMQRQQTPATGGAAGGVPGGGAPSGAPSGGGHPPGGRG